jgi:hypothetical protein
MSDRFPSHGSGADPVRDTLTLLRSDTEGVPLADSGTIRRRGQARARHQAIAGVAAVVLLVGAVVGGTAALTGRHDAAPLPGGSTTPTPSASAPATLSPDHLLTADDFPGTERGYPVFALAKDGDATADDAAESSCLTGLTVDGAVTGGRSFTSPAGDYAQTSVNVVFRLPSEDAATAAEAGITQYLADCAKRLADSTYADSQQLGDGVDFEHSMSKPDIRDAVPHESILVLRNADLVSVTSWMYITQDSTIPSDLVTLRDRMGERIGKTTTTSSSPALLQATDLPLGGNDKAWVSVPEQDAGLYTTDTCLPAYDGAQFETTDSARFSGPQSATNQQAGVQWVYAAKDPAGAKGTFTDAVDWITNCPKHSHPELSGPVTVDEKLVGTQGGVQRVYFQLTVGDVHQRIAVGQVGKAVTVVVLQRTKVADTDEQHQELGLETAIELLRPYALN